MACRSRPSFLPVAGVEQGEPLPCRGDGGGFGGRSRWRGSRLRVAGERRKGIECERKRHDNTSDEQASPARTAGPFGLLRGLSGVRGWEGIPQRLVSKHFGGPVFDAAKLARRLATARDRQLAARVAQPFVHGVHRKAEVPGHALRIVAVAQKAERLLLLLGERLISVRHWPSRALRPRSGFRIGPDADPPPINRICPRRTGARLAAWPDFSPAGQAQHDHRRAHDIDQPGAGVLVRAGGRCARCAAALECARRADRRRAAGGIRSPNLASAVRCWLLTTANRHPSESWDLRR